MKDSYDLPGPNNLNLNKKKKAIPQIVRRQLHLLQAFSTELLAFLFLPVRTYMHRTHVDKTSPKYL